MGSAKRVVHEEVCDRRELRDKGGVVFLLARVEAKVLQQQHAAGGHGLDRRRHLRTDALAQVADGAAQETAQVRGYGAQAQRLVDSALGAAEVGAEDDPGAALAEVADGRQGLAEAGVVGDAAVGEGDVEVDPHEDALALDVGLTQDP